MENPKAPTEDTNGGKMSHGQIATALAKAQAEIGQPKKDKKGYHGNMYADLAGVIKAIKKPFSDHGLSYVQIPTCTATEVTVKTILFHSSGESIESETTLPAKIIDPQKAGGAITYARRYSLNAIAGICGDDDDDGAEACGLPPVKKTKQKAAFDLARKQKLFEMMKERKVPADKMPSVAHEMQGKTLDKLDEVLKGMK